MTKRIAILLALLVLVALSVYPAIAQTTPTIYVNPNSATDNEDGTKEHPYSDRSEGEAVLQATDYGGDLYILSADGKKWLGPYAIDPARVGGGGIPLPTATLYLLLAIAALLLILAGWYLMRRSRQLQL